MAKDLENTLYLDLAKGRVEIALRPDLAPNHVKRIKELAREGFYDNVPFHRVIEGFMAQGGDPTGTGTGASKKPNLKAEFTREPHMRGVCSMARSSSPEFRQQPVLHLLRGREVPRQSVHGVGQGDVRHGACRCAEARRAGARSRPHREDAGGRGCEGRSLALLALLASVIPARATENIMCVGGDKVSIMFLVGTTPGLKPLSLEMAAGGKTWSTSGSGGATPVLISQSFDTGAMMMLDLTDDNAERVIAELRVTRAHEEGHDPVAAGTLRIAGMGVWTVVCDGE